MHDSKLQELSLIYHTNKKVNIFSIGDDDKIS